ncbi:MAG: hypothetical protein LBE35_08635 [Clostridiales bacterium]|nr:hypothetical protein [Clostridiales bacterium]
MRERLQSWLNMLNERWKGLTKSQKIRVASLVGVVLVALVFTLVLTLRTTWHPTFSEVDLATADAIQLALEDENIRTRVNTQTGVVYVPRGDEDRAWLVAQRSPAIRGDRFTFSRAIEESGMGVTGRLQSEMLQRARETELVQTFVGWSGITGAEVLLDIPDAPMLIAPIASARASVTLYGNNLSPDMGQMVAEMTANAVRGLSMNNVTVMDGTNVRMLFSDGEPQGGMMGGASAVAAVEHATLARIESAATRILIDSGLFPHATSIAHIRMDWTEVFLETWEYVNPVEGAEDDMAHRGLISEEHRSEIAAWTRETGLAIEPGTMPQDFPGGPLYAEDFPDSVLAMFENEEVMRFLYNTIHRIEQSSPGTLIVEDSSISVVASRHFTHYRDRLIAMEMLEETDAAWYAFQADLGQYYLSDEDPAVFIGLIQNATGLENISLVLRHVNIFEDMDPPPPLPISTIVLLALIIVFIALLAFGLIRRTQPVPVDDIEPELSVEDLLVSSQLAEQQEAELARMEEIRHSQDSAVKEQIDKFVTEKPDAVAQLLRNWINEDWDY